MTLAKMSRTRFLSHNAMDTIIRRVGALRVSEGARKSLAEILEQTALEVAAQAKKMAEHAGRKTITARDVRLAAE